MASIESVSAGRVVLVGEPNEAVGSWRIGAGRRETLTAPVRFADGPCVLPVGAKMIRDTGVATLPALAKLSPQGRLTVAVPFTASEVAYTLLPPLGAPREDIARHAFTTADLGAYHQVLPGSLYSVGWGGSERVTYNYTEES